MTAAASRFRVLFCGNKCFPLSYLYTRQALGPYSHITVDTLPDEEIAAKLHEYDMCVVRASKLNSQAISRGTKLKVIAQFGMGLEGVDIDAATKLGIKVGRIPSSGNGNALSCAEHAIYLILSLLRSQKGMAESLRNKTIGVPAGETLWKKIVLLIGYGNIGKELAPRLRPFGVQILAVRPSWGKPFPLEGRGHSNTSSISVGDSDTLLDAKGGTERLHEFSQQADIVVLCCPLTPKTRGMVNESFIGNMKRGALLVNVARGGLMDYNAVSAALESGQLGGLGTDVTWYEPIDPLDPILQHPKVVVTPHVAGVTETSYRAMAQIMADSVVELCEGRTVTGLEFVN